MINHIIPKWNIEEFKNLQYTLTTYKNQNIVDDYVSAGHNRKMISIYNYHEPNLMPNCVYDYIKPHFNFLNNLSIAVNFFKPGQYLPLHSDLYQKYIKVHNVNPKNIIRFIIMLEDSSPGQIIQIKNYCIGFWKSGDCFNWKYNTLHAFYNFSMNDRYAMQITGTIK
jgi:hypothetical protein